jgi:hypothetical protein
MIAALICVASVVALLQLAIPWCRSILASSRKVELSASVREITGLAASDVAPDDFDRLLQFGHLCPERGDDHTEIRAVGTYDGLMKLVRRIPGLAAWAEQERRSCSYFAAVALDRRSSSSRDLFTQQVADRL